MKSLEPHQSQPSVADDLAWQAYCYVTGEFSEQEFDAFELRLLDDQAAREAVASAVELHDALLAAGEKSMPRRSVSVWKRAVGFVAMVAAVALFIVLAQPATSGPKDSSTVATSMSASNPNSQSQRAVSDSATDQRLAELWATQLDVEEVAEVDESEAEVVEVSWPSEPAVEAAGWMWAALDANNGDTAVEDLEEESL